MVDGDSWVWAGDGWCTNLRVMRAEMLRDGSFSFGGKRSRSLHASTWNKISGQVCTSYGTYIESFVFGGKRSAKDSTWNEISGQVCTSYVSYLLFLAGKWNRRVTDDATSDETGDRRRSSSKWTMILCDDGNEDKAIPFIIVFSSSMHGASNGPSSSEGRRAGLLTLRRRSIIIRYINLNFAKVKYLHLSKSSVCPSG